MVALSDILRPEMVIVRLDAKSKKQVLWEAARRMMQFYGVNENEVFQALIARERLGSTIIHQGVALPHAKMPNINEYMAIFMRLSEPVPFHDYDKQGVDLVLVLLVPDRGGAEHLRLFAHCSQLLSDEKLCASMRDARPQTKAIAQLLGVKYSESPKQFAYS